MTVCLETNVSYQSSALSSSPCTEYIPERQERYKKDETSLWDISPLLSTKYCRDRGPSPSTHLCCLLHSLGSDQIFPQAKQLLHTFLSRIIMTNSYSTMKSQFKGYQKPLVNVFTLHFKSTCNGSSSELYRFFQLALARRSHFPVNLIMTHSTPCVLGHHQTYWRTLADTNFLTQEIMKTIFLLLLYL